MGNISCKKYRKLDESDREHFLLYDNFNNKIQENKDKVENVEKNVVSVNKTINNIVINYNRELTKLNTELMDIRKEVDAFKKNMKTHEFIESEREEKINWIQNKLMGLENQEEFLSTIQSGQNIDPLQL